MSAPRDWHASERTGLTRVARLFSNIVSPPVIYAVIGLVLSLYSLPLPQALTWAAIYGLFVSLLPILFVLWLLNTGRIEELHMSDTGERHLPYLVGIICSLLFLGIVSLAEGPDLLHCLAMFNVITLSALALINTRWLISFHAAAISSAWLIVGLVFGWQASLIVLPFVLLVVVVRLYLKRHTLAQIIAGVILGLASVWVLTLTGCFAV